MSFQMGWRGPEYLGTLKSLWYRSIPEIGTQDHRYHLDKLFKEGDATISAEDVQSLFILKALAGTEKKRAHIRTNKLWEERKIDLDEAETMQQEEYRLAYPILSYQQLRSKIPAKVRTMKKSESEMKTEEELLDEGYTLAFVDLDGYPDKHGTWRDSEGRAANTSKRFLTSVSWGHALQDLVDEEYVNEV